MQQPPTESVKCCAKCAEPKPLIDFGNETRKPDGKKSQCRACSKVSRREQYLDNRENRIASTMRWRDKNPEMHREQCRRYRAQLKSRILSAYGRKCTCCGESTPEFLTLEHINGGGRKHRGKRAATSVYREVIKANFPKDYTILCMNCNFAKGMYGQCPHNAKSQA